MDRPSPLSALTNNKAAHLALTPLLVSHHLRLLKAARLLVSERRGKQVFYLADHHHIRSVFKDMADHIEEPTNDPNWGT
jgi:DNA-binding transcriptional ArsR family regulator